MLGDIVEKVASWLTGLYIQAAKEGSSKLPINLQKGFLLGGTSAGANFTAGIAHLAAEEGLSPSLTGLLFLAGSFCHPDARPAKYLDHISSVDEINDAPGLTRKSIDYFAGEIIVIHLSIDVSMGYLVLIRVPFQRNTAHRQKTSDYPLYFLIHTPI